MKTTCDWCGINNQIIRKLSKGNIISVTVKEINPGIKSVLFNENSFDLSRSEDGENGFKKIPKGTKRIVVIDYKEVNGKNEEEVYKIEREIVYCGDK